MQLVIEIVTNEHLQFQTIHHKPALAHPVPTVAHVAPVTVAHPAKPLNAISHGDSGYSYSTVLRGKK